MIQPFKIFEGLLKPRDINSREQSVLDKAAKLYPTRKAFSKKEAESFCQQLEQDLQQHKMSIYVDGDSPEDTDIIILEDSNTEISLLIDYTTVHKGSPSHVVKIIQNTNNSYTCTVNPFLFSGEKTRPHLSYKELIHFITTTIKDAYEDDNRASYKQY